MVTIKKSTAAKPDAEQLMALSPFSQLLEPDQQKELRKLVEAATSEGPSLKRFGVQEGLGLGACEKQEGGHRHSHRQQRLEDDSRPF